MRNLSYLISFILVWNIAHCNDDGAPPDSCATMGPDHGFPPQTNPCPYVIRVSKNSLGPGESLDIELASLQPNTTDFQGFLVLAQVKGDDQITGLGKFSNNSDGQIISCLDQAQNAFTHDSADRRTSVNVTWTPPADFSGTVVFRTTFAKTFFQYWVNQTSEEVVIEGDQSITTEKPVTPDFFYKECGENKGCFGYPSNCIADRTCTNFVSFKQQENFELELAGIRTEENWYVAMGFSNDSKMGDDAVIDCTVYNETIESHLSFNEGHHNTRVDSAAVTLTEARVVDGYIYCNVQVLSDLTAQNITVNLMEPQFILMAAGRAESNRIRRHSMDASTTSAIDLTEPQIVGSVAGKGIIIKLHGAFMVVAWVFAASTGVICARYLKKSFPGKQFAGKDLWFVLHVGLMFTTWILTVAAFVMIFIEVGEWSSVPLGENPHALFGCLTMAFAFIQPIMAYFRPAPKTPKRVIFNWAHFLVGNFAHIFGIVCIFLAIFLEEAELPFWVLWVMIAFVGVYILTNGIFTIMNRESEGDQADSEKNSRDEKRKQSRQRSLLLLYVLVSLGLTIACIVAVDIEAEE